MKKLFVLLAISASFLGCSNSNKGKESLQVKYDDMKRISASKAFYVNHIFSEDVIVHDTMGNEINLKKIEINKDSVMFIFWSKSCSPCFKKMNILKSQNRQKTIQIIALSRGGKANEAKIKQIIDWYSWPFSFYFDTNESFIKYMVQNKYLTSFTIKNGHYNARVPQTYLFVNNKFHCFGCDEIINN